MNGGLVEVIVRRLHVARWAEAQWVGSWRWWERREHYGILRTRVLFNRTLIRAREWQQEKDEEEEEEEGRKRAS